MKKYFTILVGVILSSFVANAQTTIYDGETNIPGGWSIGGGFGTGYDEGPNGADCHKGEGWKLYVSGEMDIMNEGVPNPIVSGVNLTDKVVRQIRNTHGEGWAGAGLDISSYNVNISLTNKFSVLINKPIEGNVSMEINGAGGQTVSQNYTTPGQWQKLTFTFDPAQFTGHPTTLLIHPHDQGSFSGNIVTYWDEVTMYDALNIPTVIYNGNEKIGSPTAPGFFADGYWSPNGDLSDILQNSPFPNLFKTGINTSDNVMRFIRAKDGRSWCGLGIGGQNINVASTPEFSVMINKPVSGKVGMKLEGAGSQEIYADYTTPGQWEKLTFTFDPAQFTGNPNTIIIFPHFEDTNLSGQNLADHMPVYIDNVTMGAISTFTNVATTSANAISYKIYDLSGNYVDDKINKLNKGIYIKKILFDNGNIESVKLIIKNQKY
ncbi:MAG: type sorting protein [Bacteroidetes bacterium]|nr:type sorting protein [Bacteroidota bacterium]